MVNLQEKTTLKALDKFGATCPVIIMALKHVALLGSKSMASAKKYAPLV